MSDWALTLGLQNLRRQVNAAFPDRDKTSDGTIGDAAHRAHTSGHNPDDTDGSKPEWDGDADNLAEVRAWDMDSDLNAPGVTTQEVVDHVRRLPGLSSVVRYIIFNRVEYHADNGFRPQAYTGASPHTEHVHFSGARTQAADNNTSFDYRLEDLVALTDDDLDLIANRIAGIDINPDPGSSYSLAGALWTMMGRTSALNSLPGQVSAVGGKVDQVLALPGLNAQQVAAAVLAGLTPELLAAAMQAAGLTPQALAALIPAGIRKDVADELAARLAA